MSSASRGVVEARGAPGSGEWDGALLAVVVVVEVEVAVEVAVVDVG
jgi:hypothetical protein